MARKYLSNTTALIIGLGNPGSRYQGTRHNVGREIVQSLQQVLRLAEFRFEKKWASQISEGKIGQEKVALVAPDTMMNKSGKAVLALVKFYKIKSGQIFVVHDDADIKLGRAKLSWGKHSAGHKGVESIIRALHTRNFWRFRIGIAGKRNLPAEKLVLKKWTPQEMRSVKKIIKRTFRAFALALSEGPERARNEYNK